MERIFVVEDDPVVALDLLDLLRASVDAAHVEHVSLDEALAFISEAPPFSFTTVLDRLPEMPDDTLQELLGRTRVIFTNWLDANDSRNLPNFNAVERPFEPSYIVELITSHS